MKQKNPEKTTSQQLYILFQRAQDWQSLLDYAYQSPLLLRDCITNAVKSEPFFAPLMSGAIPGDPKKLHIRLHQWIQQQETASNVSVRKTQKNPILYVEEDEEFEDKSQIYVQYNERCHL